MPLPKELHSFCDIFDDLDDPRVERTKLYPLPEILLATVCAVAAGCDGWSDIEDFCKIRLEYLRGYLPYDNGIPSDDTFRRVFRAIDPKQFQACFSRWSQQWFRHSDVRESATVAIDGKCLRGSIDGAQRALYMVSAFASEARIVLGQTRVDQKSNEITAIPELLESLDLRGATVTIDAMGCQYKIAQKIRSGGADFVLGLKGNQGSLHEDVVQWFSSAPNNTHFDVHESTDKGHGRIEQRQVRINNELQWLRDRHPNWACLESVIEVKSTRLIGERVSTEKRYYVSSLPANAQRAACAIRAHWGIENALHWVLDMSFGEDRSRIRKGNSVENIAVIRHAVLNAINATKQPRQSVRLIRKRAGWSTTALDTIIQALI